LASLLVLPLIPIPLESALVTSSAGGALAAATDAPPPDSVVAFGSASLGQTSVANPNAPVVGMAPTHDGLGYWLVASDGGIFTFGDAQYYGSTGGQKLNARIVGIAGTADGLGYWLVATDGGIFTFGDAPFLGSTGGLHLNAPIVGMAATPDGLGYWLVASDGGIFAFGDAAFFGSAGSLNLNRPIVGMAATPNGLGYWLVASDGGIFTFGGAQFYGSTGGQPLNARIVGMAAKSDGLGYWLVAADGGIFTFGDAAFFGSEGGVGLTSPVVTIAASPDGAGYWVTIGSSPLGGGVPGFVAGRSGVVTAAVYDLNTSQTYEFHVGIKEAEASIVKVDIMATLFSQLGGAPVPAQTQGQLIPMIEQSDNNAATSLWNSVGGSPAVEAFDHRINMVSTTPSACASCWGLTMTTAQDQIDLLGQFVLPSPVVTPDKRQYGLSLMEQVTPSQAWGVSGGVPPGVTVALKNGWLPLSGNGDWQVNSIGWIHGDNRNYLLAVLTTGNPSEQYGINTIEGIAGMVFSAAL
jgi:hypothetical protein